MSENKLLKNNSYLVSYQSNIMLKVATLSPSDTPCFVSYEQRSKDTQVIKYS